MRREETVAEVIVAGLSAVVLFGFASGWWMRDSVSTNMLYAILIAVAAVLLWGFAKRIDEVVTASRSSTA
jgi:hypothetical protein